MFGEIITVGSELVMGNVLDTHSQYISKACSALGLEIRFHTSVRDNWEELISVIQLASKRSSVVFLCGGLGPTKDDLTKEALADFLNVKLVQDQKTLLHLQAFFQKSNRTMPENNLKQTYVFPNGTIFSNLEGTAPGLAVQQHEVTYILLPGPPRELRALWKEQVEPYLKELLGIKEVIVSRSFTFVGIGESRLEWELQDLIQTSKNPTLATYAGEACCMLTFTAKAPNHEQANDLIDKSSQEVRKRVGDFLISDNGWSLEHVLVHELKARKETVAFAESCTGGYMTHLMTTVPGSSSVVPGGLVTYSPQSKEKLARVPTQIIEEHGTISPETAIQMAEQTLAQFRTDWAVSVTGVAGPTESEDKPIGLTYIGLAHKGSPTRVWEYHLNGFRHRIQQLASLRGLFVLLQAVRKGE